MTNHGVQIFPDTKVSRRVYEMVRQIFEKFIVQLAFLKKAGLVNYGEIFEPERIVVAVGPIFYGNF